MRIIVSGGGTSGHVSPVLATVDALRLRPNPPDMLFIGAHGGVESALARDAGLRFKGVMGGKLRRLPGAGFGGNIRAWRHLVWNIRDLLYIGIGVIQALWIMAQFKPHVIFNKSGPPGLPVGVAAWILGIPMVLHEPDMAPGLGTRIMGRWASAIATGFPTELYPSAMQAKLVYTGMPVQPVILKGDKHLASQRFGLQATKPVVLVVGGSQGAKELNTALVAYLPELLQQTQVLHITGKRDAGRIGEEAHRRLESAKQPLLTYHLEPWLSANEMGEAYAAADVVVARAGASTIAELAALAKPTVLVPNTEAAAHQVQNAKALERAEAAVVASKHSDDLLYKIISLLNDEEAQKRYAKAITKFNTPDAADRLADVLLKQGDNS